MQPVTLGATDQVVMIKFIDSGDGTVEEGVSSATSGLALWYKKGATGSKTAISVSDVAHTEAHSDGGLGHVDDGKYRLCLPDAAVPTAENEVTVVGGTATGMIVLEAALVGRTTPNATTPLSAAQVNAEVDAALADYDAPTKAELDTGLAAIETDTQDIQARLPAALVSGRIDASVGAVAADAITASAIAADAIGASELAAGAASEIATAVWSALERTLTSSGALGQDDIDAIIAAITAAAVADSITTDGTTVTRRRGDTWSVALTGLGDISDRAVLWITVKRDPDHADAMAVFQVTEDDGLVVLNGAAAETAADGEIAVDDEDAGDITLTMLPSATSTLVARGDLYYDVQVLRAGGSLDTLTEGTWRIVPDVTRSVE